jgi:hypothetical protein
MAKKITKLKVDTQSTCTWQEALQSFLFFKQAQGVWKLLKNQANFV